MAQVADHPPDHSPADGAGGLVPLAAAFVWFGLPAGILAIAALDIERFLGVGYAGFGLLLGVGVAAGLVGNVLGGPLTERIGTSASLSRGALAWSFLTLGAALAPFPWLFALLFVLAFSAGAVADVAMNVAATAALGARPGRLARFHALWNAGSLAGAVAVALLLAHGVSWRWALGATSVAGFTVALITARSTLPAAGAGEAHPPWAGLVFLWRDRILLLALALLAAAIVEGGVDTWGVLFLRAQLALGVLAGAGAFFIGQSLAVGSRTLLGPVAGRLRPALAAAVAAALATLGLSIEAVAPPPVAPAAGLALAIAGIALCWPLLMAAGSRASPRPALAVGGMTTAAYGGFLLGPVVVGSVAGSAGLRPALLLLAGAALIPTAAALAPGPAMLVRRRRRSR